MDIFVIQWATEVKNSKAQNWFGFFMIPIILKVFFSRQAVKHICIQRRFWKQCNCGTQSKTQQDIELLERAQRRATMLVRGLKNKS